MRYLNQRYLLEVVVILRPQKMKLVLLFFGGAHQQIVEHMVIPEGHKAQWQSIRTLFTAQSLGIIIL